jgi:hypothetical protein
MSRVLLAFGERGTFRAKVFIRQPRARLDAPLKQGFHSPLASESLSFASSKESNQRKDDPGIRAGRTSFVLFPAVLVNHRPANNSAIPGLKQFAFPRWSTPLLGAAAGDPKVKSEARAVVLRCLRTNGTVCAVSWRRRRALDVGSPAEAPRSGAGHRGKANCLRPGMAELFAGRWPASTAGHRSGKARSARMPGCPSLWLPFSWASKRK